ncbi:C2H2-type domain-containing protein [Plasmodiophora brassicae]
MARVIAVLGCTGVGKTRLSIELALALGNCEIVNADSMQVYRGFNVGSAKVREEEMQGVPHHVLSIADVEHPINVLDFVRAARQAIDDVHARGNTPILVGGTVYYVAALLFNTFLASNADGDHDGASSTPCQTGIAGDSYATLQALDPDMAERLHPNDIRRIRRSLEVVAQKQQKHSELLAQSGGRHGIGPPRYRTLAIWLDAAPDVIEDRIQKRTESMFQDGIFDENVQLYEQLKLAYGNDLDKVYGTGIGQAIGFREFRHCFEASGELLAGALRQSVVDLNRNTFRFAKRQQRNIASWFGGRDNLPVFRIDTSDATSWSNAVLQPAVDICKSFVDPGVPDPNPDAYLHLHEVLAGPKAPERRSDQGWRKFACEDCGRILNGALEWRVHLQSRSHRRHAKRKHVRQCT